MACKSERQAGAFPTGRPISFTANGQARWEAAVARMRSGFEAAIRELDSQRLAARYDAMEDRKAHAGLPRKWTFYETDIPLSVDPIGDLK